MSIPTVRRLDVASSRLLDLLRAPALSRAEAALAERALNATNVSYETRRPSLRCSNR